MGELRRGERIDEGIVVATEVGVDRCQSNLSAKKTKIGQNPLNNLKKKRNKKSDHDGT